ncbi:hypothetical protein GW17_00021826 [Ensete ventricosum]|nr:hypothetical protein GW17_00021826 [Ensete ventricosum]
MALVVDVGGIGTGEDGLPLWPSLLRVAEAHALVVTEGTGERSGTGEEREKGKGEERVGETKRGTNGVTAEQPTVGRD